MQFGTKRSEAKSDFGDSGDFLPYLRNFREGDNIVRFIEEVDDWIAFSEHYAGGKSFPCTNDRNTCPGCTSEDDKVSRASRKYATNLQLVANDKVLPFRVPMSLAKKLFNRAERNGTITNRDYVVMREGKGLETEYDLEQDEKRSVDLGSLKSQAHDIENILLISYNEVWGVDAQRVEKASKEQVAQEAAQEEKPPFDTGEATVVTEAELRKMTRAQLVTLALAEDIEIDEDGSKEDILDSILELAG